MEKKDYLFLILAILIIIIYSFSTYYLNKKIKENSDNFKNQIDLLKSEISSFNSSIQQRITSEFSGFFRKQGVYSKTETKTFKRDVYAPQLVLKCDHSEDIILSGTCAGLPSVGGDKINIQGTYNPTNDAFPYVTDFQCVGPVYDVKGDYSIWGSIVCLRG